MRTRTRTALILGARALHAIADEMDPRRRVEDFGAKHMRDINAELGRMAAIHAREFGVGNEGRKIKSYDGVKATYY